MAPSERIQADFCLMGLIAGETPAPRKTPATGHTHGDDKMTFSRKLTSIASAAALAATALGPLATSANAEGWRDGRRGGPDYAYSDHDHWKGDRHGKRHHRWGHRRRDRDDTGKYIALGIGALMLGIIASEAGRH
jgi:hypothetical protein